MPHSATQPRSGSPQLPLPGWAEHRAARIIKHAASTGQYPVAVLSGCVVYAADGPSPLDVLACKDGKPSPGGF
ncbi:hypothetical protein ACIOC1_13410 [Streptomyces sp. NPDC088197]|uniref:hypothetical protein n=1 Tax=Streptomyces sp. NPDC088197 TaxID=3365840 RepID=UPI0038113E01